MFEFLQDAQQPPQPIPPKPRKVINKQGQAMEVEGQQQEQQASPGKFTRPDEIVDPTSWKLFSAMKEILGEDTIKKLLGTAQGVAGGVTQGAEAVKGAADRLTRPTDEVTSADVVKFQGPAKLDPSLFQIQGRGGQDVITGQEGAEAAKAGGAIVGAAVDPNPAKRDTSIYGAVGQRGYETLLDFLGDSGKKLGKNYDQPTYAPAALHHALGQLVVMGELNPEIAQQFASQLLSLQTPEDKAATAERKKAKGAEQEASALGEQVEAKKAEHKNKVQELFEAQELQSWGSVLAYIALSLFIGPRMAFLFFSNAQKKGMLKYELDQIKSDGRRLAQVQAQKEQEAKVSRGRAADIMLKGGIRQDDRRWAVMRDQQRIEMQHAARLEEIEARAMAKGVSENPEYKKVKDLIGVYNQRARIAISQAKDADQSELYGQTPKGTAEKFRAEAARQNALAEDAIGILLEMIK